MTWPNDDSWKALAAGEQVEQDDTLIVLSVVDCGELVARTGRLVVCDPFTGLSPTGNRVIPIPAGRFPVKVTLADVSGLGDGSHLREAYATLILSDAPETRRRVWQLRSENGHDPSLVGGEFQGFPVDSGTACFVDEGALASGMPDRATWYEDVFESDESTAWYSQLRDPDHLRKGLANVPLPLATDGSNAVLFRSGWGDGIFPVIAGYDAADNLVRIHVDFLVIDPADE
jgi:Protein of unknown function (DUF4241)